MHLQVLSSIREEAANEPEEAIRAVARLCEFLHVEAERLELGEVAAAAAALAEAAPEEIDAGAERLEAALLAARAAAQPATVLVVEDEATTVEIVRSALTAGGHRVVVAETCDRALALVTEETPDLILMDLMLPDLDGRTLLTRLRRLPGTRLTPIVVLSAKVGAGVKAECFAYGAVAYLEKPTDPATLHDAITPFLAGGVRDPTPSRPLLHVPAREEIGARFEQLQNLRQEGGTTLTAALLVVAPAPGGAVAEAGARASGQDVRRLLGRLASEMRTLGRPDDVVVQWNADELLLLCPGSGVEEVARVVDHLRRAVPRRDGEVWAGVVPVRPGAALLEVVAEADRLLSRALDSPSGAVVRRSDLPPEGRSVVVAEDDSVTAALVCHQMAGSGFQVEHCVNGREAWARIREAPPALVVLDIQLPGMNGFELLARMKEEAATREVRVILLTSLGGERNISRAFALGADDYLVKPFSPGELVARALRLVRNR